MKAITLCEPWATLISLGLKTIETRTHGRFRCLEGERIAIHAGQRFDRSAWWTITDILAQIPHGRAAYDEDRLNEIWDEIIDWGQDMFGEEGQWNQGTIVATATVAEARWGRPGDSLGALCDAAGRFCLVLADVHRLERRIFAKGHQGIWTCEALPTAPETPDLFGETHPSRSRGTQITQMGVQ